MLEKCIVFCAGGFTDLISPIGDGDFVLAADGGLRHTQKLGCTPNEILGDFDSLGFVPEGANVFPVEKDDTDAMLAVRRGLSKGYRLFVIYGGLDGPRLDHMVANFQTLHFLADHHAFGLLVGNTTLAAVIQNGAIHFPEGLRGTISVFCTGEDAQGVDIEGLYYPLQNGTLSAGFPLGVSNHFTGKPARISVRQGSLLILWERGDGLPSRVTMEGLERI